MTAQLSTVAQSMSAAASAFLGSLEAEQRAKACFPFPANDERQRWYYTPYERGGLPLAEMPPPARQRAHALIASGLSAGGYATAAVIMGLENILAAVEGWRGTGYPGRTVASRARDPEMYFVSIFGDPQYDTWGWRLGGHHLALQSTIVAGALVASTPCFFGADPAVVPLVGPSVLEPLAGEANLARRLVQALDATQRSTAVVAPVPPTDITQANRTRVEDGALPLDVEQMYTGIAVPAALTDRINTQRALTAQRLGLLPAHLEAVRYMGTKGLAAGSMTAAQRALLLTVVHQYIDRLPSDAAVAYAAKLEGKHDEALHFAWAGGLEPGVPHYYRVQGARLLIEYDNAQGDGNHIHSVLRDPEGDFGMDVLAAHYARAH